MKKIITTIIVIASLVPAGLAFASPHMAGTNVKGPDGTIYFITPDGQRRPYTSAGAFLSYGLNSFSNVSAVSTEDLNMPLGSFIPPQDGKIICSDRGSDKGTCYLISQSTKIGFPTAEIFIGQGFNFKNALYGDTSFLPYTSNITSASQAHSPGVLINNAGTIYFSGSNGLMGIPSMQTFLSWGYTLADVAPANTADMARPILGLMPIHTAGLLSPLGQTAIAPNPSPYTANPTPSPTPSPTPQANYQAQTNTTTPIGAVTVAVDGGSPGAQQIPMSKKSTLLYTVNLAETTGNEPINLRGLTITATVTGGFNNGNSIPNTAYYTLKNLSLVSGSTVISRPTFSAATPPREGAGSQTYQIDFNSGSPLNFQIPASGSIALSLKADLNDWSTGAAANSAWTFSINTPSDVTLVGQNTGATITPTVNSSAASALTTIIKQPITFNPVTSTPSGGKYTFVSGTGIRNTQENVGIFNALSPSTALKLNSITISQSGSALPTGTSSAVTYYVYDYSQDLSHPVGSGVLNGGGSVTINLNLNSAFNGFVNIPADGSNYLVITADTSNFSACGQGNNACSPYSYSLSLSGWQYSDSNVPGITYSGPLSPDTSKTAIYLGSTGRSY